MGCACFKNYDAQYAVSGVPRASRSGAERVPTPLSFEEFDKITCLPNLLVELRQIGFIEISGKNHFGVLERLGLFLQKEWGCTLKTDDEVPICDVRYELPEDLFILSTNAPDRDHRENNMGRLVLSLVGFMANELGWTLALCNLTGVSPCAEAQIKFKAPNPLNLIAPHMLIELRSPNVTLGGAAGDGFIQMNLTDPSDKQTQQAVGALGGWVRKNWGLSKYDWGNHPEICDMKVRTNALQIRGMQGENNIGLKTVEMADFMMGTLEWTMLTCDFAGDIKRNQQMIFRWDTVKQKSTMKQSTVLLVELRQLGYVEISGQDNMGVYNLLDKFLKQKWSCSEFNFGANPKFCDKKYNCPAMDPSRPSLADLGMQLVEYMQDNNWNLFTLNGGELKTDGEHGIASGYGINDVRFHGRPSQELQLKFLSPQIHQLPLPVLLLQLRADTYHPGRIMISGKDMENVYEKLDAFVTKELGSARILDPQYCIAEYLCPAFYLGSGHFAGSNLDYITMRFCDFLEDHVGGWELIACSSHHPTNTQMEQIIAFRFSGAERKALQHTRTESNILGSIEHIVFPGTWKMIDPSQPLLGEVHQTCRVTLEERDMLQALLDDTFKAVKTRDREGDLPTRLTIVEAVASEHVELYRRYSEARDAIDSSYRIHDFWRPVTQKSELAVRSELSHQKNEAYVMHGTQPSSALSILNSGFSLDLAGDSTGLMFGKGIYTAERSSKADEYAKADKSHPGLCAMLVCRAAVGRCFVVNDAGDNTAKLASGYCETILGDRETTKGTYREFVIGSADRLYPEYAVMYMRHYDGLGRAPVPRAPGREREEDPTRKSKSSRGEDPPRESNAMREEEVVLAVEENPEEARTTI